MAGPDATPREEGAWLSPHHVHARPSPARRELSRLLRRIRQRRMSTEKTRLDGIFRRLAKRFA